MSTSVDVQQPTDEPAAEPAASDGPHPLGKLVGIAVALATLITCMALAFALPGVNSGPHDITLAVSGPDQAVKQITTALETNAPGVYEITQYPSEEAVTDAIKDRDMHGGLVLGPQGATLYVASAGGTPIATVLKATGAALGQALGAEVPVKDLAPYTSDDPQGIGLAALALPMSMGGIIPAVVMINAFKRRLGLRVAGVLLISVLAGFAITAVLQFWVHTIDGVYWETSLVLALTMAAISLTALGVESLLGMPGFGVLALLMIFLANPLSGLTTSPDWLPSPWGAIGQWLPPGAGGTAIRSTAFFGGAGMAHALAVLTGWAAFGLLLTVIAGLRGRTVRRSTVTAA